MIPTALVLPLAGNRICYSGDVGTKTASLDLIKLVVNSVLSRKDAKYVTFDISNFYLQTPLDCPEYVCINLSDISRYFIDKYDLLDSVRDGWVYFKINRGVHKWANTVLTPIPTVEIMPIHIIAIRSNRTVLQGCANVVLTYGHTNTKTVM